MIITFNANATVGWISPHHLADFLMSHTLHCGTAALLKLIAGRPARIRACVSDFINSMVELLQSPGSERASRRPCLLADITHIVQAGNSRCIVPIMVGIEKTSYRTASKFYGLLIGIEEAHPKHVVGGAVPAQEDAVGPGDRQGDPGVEDAKEPEALVACQAA